MNRETSQGPAVITLPDEIDSNNAELVTDLLTGALTRGVVAIIADLTPTTFCDSAGVRALILAYSKAAANDTELRLVVPPDGSPQRIFSMLGLDQLLHFYPTVEQALAPGSPPGPAG
jgi:anti-sigma B factor antagonist